MIERSGRSLVKLHSTMNILKLTALSLPKYSCRVLLGLSLDGGLQWNRTDFDKSSLRLQKLVL